MYAIRSYYGGEAAAHPVEMFDPDSVVFWTTSLRITSYNVCYTKLLRIPPFLSLLFYNSFLFSHKRVCFGIVYNALDK